MSGPVLTPVPSPLQVLFSRGRGIHGMYHGSRDRSCCEWVFEPRTLHSFCRC